MLEVDTPHGRANVHLHAVGDPAAALVLGHGGGVTARDLGDHNLRTDLEAVAETVRAWLPGVLLVKERS